MADGLSEILSADRWPSAKEDRWHPQNLVTKSTPSFAELLQHAVEDPGIISSAYSQFHHYSIGNQILAWVQCQTRGLQPGPLATYERWRELGRQVRRGEKAITLCMPVTVKRTIENEDHNEPEAEVFTRFVYRPNWFVLAQTDGEPLGEQPSPGWDKDRALASLQIQEVSLDSLAAEIPTVRRQRFFNSRWDFSTKMESGFGTRVSTPTGIHHLGARGDVE